MLPWGRMIAPVGFNKKVEYGQGRMCSRSQGPAGLQELNQLGNTKATETVSQRYNTGGPDQVFSEAAMPCSCCTGPAQKRPLTKLHIK